MAQKLLKQLASDYEIIIIYLVKFCMAINNYYYTIIVTVAFLRLVYNNNGFVPQTSINIHK